MQFTSVLTFLSDFYSDKCTLRLQNSTVSKSRPVLSPCLSAAAETAEGGGESSRGVREIPAKSPGGWYSNSAINFFILSTIIIATQEQV